MGGSKGWNKFAAALPDLQVKSIEIKPQRSSRKLFSFSPQTIKDPEDAFQLVKGLILPGFLISIEWDDKGIYFTEYPIQLGENIIPFPHHYIYEIVDDKAVYLDSDKKERE